VDPSNLSPAALAQIFTIFKRQLLQLIGLPSLPNTDEDIHEITEWQINTLLRRRLRENVRDSQDTLTSIMHLVASLSNLPIGKSVQKNVKSAVDALQKVLKVCYFMLRS
jgi:hypothetical protein